MSELASVAHYFSGIGKLRVYTIPFNIQNASKKVDLNHLKYYFGSDAFPMDISSWILNFLLLTNLR